MQDVLGGLAVWAAHKQGGQLCGIADDLERLAQDARSAEREFNSAAAEYHASLTPNFGEIEYNRLCNLAAVKRPQDGMRKRTREIVIVDDATIKANRGVITLQPDEIALLNKIVKHREWHLPAFALRQSVPMADGGQRLLPQSEFRVVYSGLATKIESITGESLLMRAGSGRSICYVLSMTIQFVDERTTQTSEEEMIVDEAEKTDWEEDVVIVTTNEVTDFSDVVLEAVETLAEDVQDSYDAPPELVIAPVELIELPKTPDAPSVPPPVVQPPKGRKFGTLKPEVITKVLDTWHSAAEIARATGLPSDIIAIFIDRNKHRLGRDFKSPQMRPRPHPTARGDIMVQCYSPDFSDWAIASLEAAKRRLAEQDTQNTDDLRRASDQAMPES